jgi:N-acetylmuramoyl-L-alanine amidase
MGKQWKGLFVLGLLSLSMPGHAQQVDISSLHYTQAAKKTRLVFDVSASPKHRVFVQNKPTQQLIIDIKDAKLAQTALSQPTASHPLFAKIHILEKTRNNIRLGIDLKQPVTAKNFSLSSNNKNEHKLIVDLINKGNETDSKSIASKAGTKENLARKTVENIDKSTSIDITAKKEKIEHKNQQETENKSVASETSSQPVIKKEVLEHKITPIPVRPIEPATMLAALKTERANSKAAGLQKASYHVVNKHNKFVIAIDAGHGGQDPGAHGTNGTEEKQVVFAIAKKLAKLINSQPDMKAVMVRKGDYYVGLRKRMQIARAANADLFISIHADAFQDTTVKGSSVYVLSESGASSEAALWLAKSENASDLIGGVSLEDKEDVLATVLLDLSQSATKQASVDVAQSVIKSCHSVGELHKNQVQKAGFMVLKSPDIPSILVETAFISNPSEEENLLNTEYQTKMAGAIFQGVRDYFKSATPPVDTKVAAL